MKYPFRFIAIAGFLLIGWSIVGIPVSMPPAFGADIEYSGQVVKVDPAKNNVIVKNPQSGGRLKFVVTDKTTIASGGEKKALGDLKSGDGVEVEYALEGGKYIAHKIMLKPAEEKY